MRTSGVGCMAGTMKRSARNNDVHSIEFTQVFLCILPENIPCIDSIGTKRGRLGHSNCWPSHTSVQAPTFGFGEAQVSFVCGLFVLNDPLPGTPHPQHQEHLSASRQWETITETPGVK